jgi:hypothetical protein
MEDELSGELIGKVRNIWNSVAAYARDRRRCAQIRRDLNSLGPHERRRVLDEYELMPEDFEQALRIPFASEDMSSRALTAVGVDPQQFHREHGARNRSMRRTCTMCRAKARCRQDLLAGSFVRNHRDYCPNRLHFAVLLARQPYRPMSFSMSENRWSEGDGA